ncbi:MAG: hypothetical protein OEW75_17100, partial [Cyclobacteriaceae bacterium]|nr:hypothetical protein [Cyclobacteriaceae bacterium]
TIQYGHNYQITNKNYLHQLGVKEDVCTTNQLWKELLLRTLQFYPEEMAPWASSLNEIIKKGTLASRILEVANGVYAKENLQLIYQEIGENLASNQLFNSCDPTLS